MRRSTLIIVVGVGLAVGATLVAWRLWPARVEVGQPVRSTAVEAVYATGAVEPSVMMPVAPRAGGRLVSIETDEGAKVQRGQVMARVESADLEHTVQEMRAHEHLARAQYKRTQDLVAQKFVSSADLDRTRSELQAAEAALKRAKAQRDYNQLVRQDRSRGDARSEFRVGGRSARRDRRRTNRPGLEFGGSELKR